MKDWMLTWSEIVAARLESREVSYQVRLKGESTEFDFTNKAQARKIFVWLNSDCIEPHSDGFTRTHKDCKFCMKQFCKEVGL
jgi:hypothetical protein